MKASTRIVSLLLAALLLFGMTACGNKTTTTEPSSNPSAAPSTDPAANPLLPNAKDPVTLTIGIVQNVSVIDYETNDYTKYLEEQTGYNLDFVLLSSDHAEAITQLTAMMAAGEKLPDIIYGVNGLADLVHDWGNQGYLLDLTPYMNDKDGATKVFWTRMKENFSESEVNFWTAKSFDSIDGKYYTIPSVQVSGGDKLAAMAFINQQWLDKLNLKIPTNWDELVNVLRHFRDDDPNGNGKKDEIPMLGGVGVYRADPITWLMNTMFYIDDNSMNGNHFFCADDSGKLFYPQITEQYREALKKIKVLVDEGLLSTSSWTIANKTEMLAAAAGIDDTTARAGILIGHKTVLFPTAGNAVVNQYVGFNNWGYWPLEDNNGRNTLCISADCKNPNEAVALVMAMMSEESAIRARYGIEGRDWEFQKDENGNEKRYQINANTWSGADPQNITWCFLDGVICNFQTTKYAGLAKYEDPMTDANKLSKMYADYWKNYVAMSEKTSPKYVVHDLIFNAEEAEANGDIKTTLSTFIASSRAEFLNGTRNLDSDWNKYVEQFNALGTAKYLENAQAAFNRTIGK